MTTTPERTPATELCAAAAKLRAVAEIATGGPWEIRPGNNVSSNIAASAVEGGGWMVIDGGGWSEEVDGKLKAVVYGAALNADAAWITLMHPGMAEPLAKWLEDAARGYEGFAEDHGHDVAERVVWHALAVARVVNGGGR